MKKRKSKKMYNMTKPISRSNFATKTISKAKNASFSEKKLEIAKEILRAQGYSPSRFSPSRLKQFSRDLFKGINGKALKSFGANFAKSNLATKTMQLIKKYGQVNIRKIKQATDFANYLKQYGDSENAMTFGQFISSQNVREFYQTNKSYQDIFSFIKEKNIKEYNFSEGWYMDPLFGGKKWF